MKIALDFYNKIFNSKLMNIRNKSLIQNGPDKIRSKNGTNNNLNLLKIN